jgi:anaerobic sulfite reductase subunit A
MSYFYENTFRVSEADEKAIILFVRPCDINGIRRLDTIFLKNGGQEDSNYRRLRDKLKIIMLECLEGWDTCFCVSMNSNRTEDYDAAVRMESDHVLIQIKDDDLNRYFYAEGTIGFVPDF